MLGRERWPSQNQELEDLGRWNSRFARQAIFVRKTTLREESQEIIYQRARVD